MNSPLAIAEFSRLRKSIQQRERLLAQNNSAASAELSIERALSSLKLYLWQSQPELATVLKDWENADKAGRTQITTWIRWNVLGEQTASVATIASAPASAMAHSTFVAPPPPPPFTRTQSVSIRPHSVSYMHAPAFAHSSGEFATKSLKSSPPETSETKTSVSPRQSPIESAPTPPLREIYTHAAPKPPTPPPKNLSRTRSLFIGHGRDFLGVERPAPRDQGTLFGHQQPGFSRNPLPDIPSSQSDLPAPVSETHPRTNHGVPAPIDNGGDLIVAADQTELHRCRASEPADLLLTTLIRDSAKQTNDLLEEIKTRQTLCRQGAASEDDTLIELLGAYMHQQKTQTDQIITALQLQQFPLASDVARLLVQSQQENQERIDIFSRKQLEACEANQSGSVGADRFEIDQMLLRSENEARYSN